MCYDFYFDNHSEKPDFSWNRYTITKCTDFEDNSNYKKNIRDNYKEKQIDEYSEFIDLFDIDNEGLPKESVLLEVKFILKKRFLTNGDEQFWPNKQNPIAKEKVLKIPIMRSSSWKGCLRSTAIKEGLIDKDSNELFGNPKKSEDSKKGKLNFFTTFFEDIGLDVIAPQDRESGTAKKRISPIHLEVVPAGTPGCLKILYYPFDLLGDDNIEETAEEDIKKIIKTIKKALTKYGFGAKTAEGYGTAEIEQFNLEINFDDYEFKENIIEEKREILND